MNKTGAKPTDCPDEKRKLSVFNAEEEIRKNKTELAAERIMCL